MRTKTLAATLLLLGAAFCAMGWSASAGAQDTMDHGRHNMPAAAQHEHWTVPDDAASRPNPVPADKASRERGGALYRVHCAACHGSGGRGDGPAGAALKPKPTNLSEMAGHHPDGELAWKIENGRGPMPAWKGTLTQGQIWDVVNFIRGLATGERERGSDRGHDAAPGHKH